MGREILDPQRFGVVHLQPVDGLGDTVPLAADRGNLPQARRLIALQQPIVDLPLDQRREYGDRGRIVKQIEQALEGFQQYRRDRAESRANAALEMRVAERTAALSRTQAELVQAGKLSALGQMSAGISHELNQPLMAISSYAENGTLLLDRGRVKDAAENLEKISEMARRMGRIIRNLRAFARAESEPATRVGLASVVEGALELVQGRIARAGVAIDWQRPESPAIVMGGEVRLGQVVVNLIANALDALEGAEEKRITIRIARAGERVRLTIRDTGPGIAEPARIFDPFYSTKEVGSAEGMGLGLSISYGLVQGFGGTLSGETAPGGGALFTVDLRAAPVPGGEP